MHRASHFAPAMRVQPRFPFDVAAEVLRLPQFKPVQTRATLVTPATLIKDRRTKMKNLTTGNFYKFINTSEVMK
jgi:hypothetical protein